MEMQKEIVLLLQFESLALRYFAQWAHKTELVPLTWLVATNWLFPSPAAFLSHLPLFLVPINNNKNIKQFLLHFIY